MEEKSLTTILQLHNISKIFPGVQALTNANLDVFEGEIHGVVGKNGAGKSTLMAILMGIQQPDGGTLQINGREFTSMSPHDAGLRGLEAGL